ncbi:MAG: hypothetical protein A4S09_08885 [Proteobacteria bacterium SG_bin7]|nr:MAG: hypothetical protein A4S09_08885 [Proteobacteria bacterium SG_bin7]
MKSSSLAMSQNEEFFSDRDVETIYELTEAITGTCQVGKFRKSILVNNVRRRMDHHGIEDLKEYVRFAKSEKLEMDYLVSALTIHTTSWFREPKQYEILEKRVTEVVSTYRQRPLRVLCAACSTGEEVYSFALMLERMREFYNGFDYQIDAFDIDPVSTKVGEKAIYRTENGYDDISDSYKRFLLVGNGKTEGFFTLVKAIRDRCKFAVRSLKDGGEIKAFYDVVICRNVLIYFKRDEAQLIAKSLLAQMDASGMFITGTSEAVVGAGLDLINMGASCFVHKGKENLVGRERRRKCLIVEDSAIDRAIMKRQFEKFGLDCAWVGSAEEATAYLESHKVDIITLDLHLPKQSGFEWLKEQRQKQMKTPVVIISGALPHEAQKVLDALGSGAQDYFNKNDLRKSAREIVERLEAIVHHNVVSGGKGITAAITAKKANEKVRPDLILIGASTGGTEALVHLLQSMPEDCPPVLVVQHIAQQFAQAFYERLSKVSNLKMVKPADHMLLSPGHLYMSGGDYHIGVGGAGGVYRLKIGTSMSYSVHRPSVDYLFKSACRVGGNITAILLTGMGKDGARGLLELYKKGALTYCQDEASCVVYGMPKEAVQLGAAKVIGNLPEIRKGLLSNL